MNSLANFWLTLQSTCIQLLDVYIPPQAFHSLSKPVSKHTFPTQEHHQIAKNIYIYIYIYIYLFLSFFLHWCRGNHQTSLQNIHSDTTWHDCQRPPAADRRASLCQRSNILKWPVSLGVRRPRPATTIMFFGIAPKRHKSDDKSSLGGPCSNFGSKTLLLKFLFA